MILSHDFQRRARNKAMRFALACIAISIAGMNAFVSGAPFVPARDAHCVAFSSDGKLVAVGISGQSNSEFPPRPHPSPRKCGLVQIFDLATKKRLRRVETFGDLTRVAFSPDGTLVAASRLFVTDDGIEMNEVRVWEVATGRTYATFDRCHTFCFVPTANQIAVASRKRCVTYALDSLVKTRQFPQLADAISLAAVKQGTSLCGIVKTQEGCVLRTVALASGDPDRQSPPIATPFYQMATPADGGLIATGHPQGQVLLWDVTSLRPTRQWSTGSPGRALPFFSGDGRLLGAADQSNSDVVLWQMSDGQELVRYTFHQGSIHTYGSRSASRMIRPEEDPARFAFSPEGDSFLGGPFGGILRLVSTGQDVARFGE